ncbi:MAG: TIGR04211 family SH3 domain-containing protein [Gammaproteobacteria bacterium]
MRGILGFALLFVVGAAAFAEDKVRYVTDELAIVLRDAPGDGPSRGQLLSGARVVVLESRPDGYARVRTADGREGWIIEKYVQPEPAARARLAQAGKELAAAQAELKALKEDNARLLEDFARISGGQPVASRELMDQNEKMKARMAENDQQVAAVKTRYGAEAAQQRTLAIGGALVIAGGVLALVLRGLLSRKRRYGDF